MQAKMAAHKPLVRPHDTRVIARQSAMRRAGLPVTVDGHWGPRSRFNWAQAADVKAGYQSTLAQTRPGFWKDTALMARLEEMKHQQGGGVWARRIAVKVGVRGAERGSLHEALVKNSGRIGFDQYDRRVKARVNMVRPGTFGEPGSFIVVNGKRVRIAGGDGGLMAARLAARGVKARGLGALDADELLWLWNHDGRGRRKRLFTTAMQTKDGLVSKPGEELVRGMQEFARRHGEDVRVTGKLDVHSYDAFMRAADRQQRQREARALRDARAYYSQGNAWTTAQQATGLPMSFDQAWKKAGSGGEDAASVAAVHTLIVASELALRHAADENWKRERQRAYDQAIWYASGTNPYVREDDTFSLGGIDDEHVLVDGREESGPGYRKSPWQGTPFGLYPGDDRVMGGIGEKTRTSPLRTPPWMAMAAGVPEIYAVSSTQAQAEFFIRMQQYAELQRQKVAGTNANARVVEHTTKIQVPVRNPDGTIKMQAASGPRGGVTRAPVMETQKIVTPYQYELQTDPMWKSAIAKAYDVTLGWLPPSVTEGNAIWTQGLGAVVAVYRQSEYLAFQSLKAGVVSGETYHPDERGFGAYGLAPMTWHEATATAEAQWREAPWYMQFALSAVYDPLNFAGPLLKGGSMFARATRMWYRAEEAENGLVAGLQGAMKAVDAPIANAAARTRDGAGAISRAVIDSTPAPIRGQFVKVKAIRQANRELQDEARAMGFDTNPRIVRDRFGRERKIPGTGVHPDLVKAVLEHDMEAVRYAQGNLFLGPLLEHMAMNRASFYTNARMSQLSELGEIVMRVLMAASEPSQLAKLRHTMPELVEKGIVNDLTLALHNAGGTFGTRGSFLTATIRKGEGQLRWANGEHVLKPLERYLRRVGDYQFVDHDTWRYADGTPERWYPQADPPELVALFRRELDSAYQEMRGGEVELENLGYGQVMSKQDRDATVTYLAQDAAERRMAAWRRQLRIEGGRPDAARAEEQLKTYILEERVRLERLFPRKEAFDEADLQEMERQLAEQTAKAADRVQQLSESVRGAERNKRNLERGFVQLLLESAQASPHLAAGARAFTPEGGLPVSAVEDAAVGELTRQEADVRAHATMRKLLHEYLGETFDISSIEGLVGTGQRLKTLTGVLEREVVGWRLRGLGIEPELMPDGEIDYFEDVAVETTKLQEDKLRWVFARMMVGDFKREGLFGDAEQLGLLRDAIEGSSRGTDLLELVQGMPYKHSGVMVAQGELDRAVAARNELVDRYLAAREARLPHDQLEGIRWQLLEAHEDELLASDQLYSKLFALQSRPNMEKILDRAKAEYAYFAGKKTLSDEERALKLARRVQIRKIDDYLQQTRQAIVAREMGVQRRALVRQRRLIGDAERELRDLTRQHADAETALRGYQNRTSPRIGVGGYVDMRRTVTGRHNPDAMTQAQNMGIVGSHHDAIAHTLEDPRLADLGARTSLGGSMVQRRKARVNLLDPSQYQSHLFVYADDFKGGDFVGEVHGAHERGPDDEFVPHQGPPEDAKVLYLTELSESQLFDILSSGGMNPAATLRQGPARQHVLDVAERYEAVSKGASGHVATTERGPLPPQLGDSIRDLYQQWVMAGNDLREFDYSQIEQLARANPRYREAIHHRAQGEVAKLARIDGESAIRQARNEMAVTQMQQQGQFAQAWRKSGHWSARLTWNAWNAIMEVWRFAVMPVSMAYQVANHLGDLTRAVMIAGVTPQELVAAHAGLATNLVYALVKAPFEVLYHLAGRFDTAFATRGQEALRNLLRWFEGVHHSALKALWDVQEMPWPEELADATETASRGGFRDADDANPFDLRSTLERYRASKGGRPVGDPRILMSGLYKGTWNMLGDAPEMWRRRLVWKSIYERELLVLRRDRKDLSEVERQAIASERGLEAVTESLFDYEDVPVLIENLKLIAPFPTFPYKMAALTPRLAMKQPWLFPAVWRLEHMKDPVTGEEDPLAGYVDVTWLVDPVFGLLHIDRPYADQGIGLDIEQLFDFRKTYKAFMGPQNPHLAPNAGGRDFVNTVVGYLDMSGLGLNPYIRSGLQATDLMHSESWRSIFPEASMMEALSANYLNEQFPDGFNLERAGQDWLYEKFHDGTSLTELRESDISYMTNIEVARQVEQGLDPDYDRARRDVRSFLAASAVFSLVAGVWTRRLNPADQELMRMRDMGRTDYEGLSPHQLAVNAIYRLRGESEEAMRRAVELYPMLETYYSLTDYQHRQRLLMDHPELAAYVQWSRLRKEFTSGTVEEATRTRRTRDHVLATQAAAIGRMYGIWKRGTFDSETRGMMYDVLLTPELKDWFARTATPQEVADEMIRGEFYGYMNKVSDAFHDIPDDDYAGKQRFMERNPWLADYWQVTGQERKDARNLMNGINASYRAWYFTVIDTEGFDAAASILKEHPYMFDHTKSSNRVDRYLGTWVPKDKAAIAKHAEDYRRMKGKLDAYFGLRKGKAREAYVAAHPDLAAYFKEYGQDRHFRRRFGRAGGRRFRFAAASNPHLARRVEFWHHFFALRPDDRLKYIEKAAKDTPEIFTWGPTADSIFTDRAHGFSFGRSARLDAYRQIAPLLALFFELKEADRKFFLQVNPELQMYFDQFSTSSPTGDAKLDRVLEKFFDLGPEAKDDYLAKHPELQDWFDSKRTTPEEKALGALLDAYFGLPKGVARKKYLLTHPELEGYFDKRKDERDLETSWMEGLVDADPRLLKFQKTLEYEQAVDELHVRRAALIAGKVEGRHTTRLTARPPRAVRGELVRSERAPTS